MSKESLISQLSAVIDVPKKGGRVVIDADFMASTLPSNLSADNFKRSIQHVTDLTEAAEVALATKCIERAKDDTDFDMADLEMNVAPNLRLSSTWHRKTRRAKDDGHYEEVYGSLLSTATLSTSSAHQENLKQLETAAANILNL